MLSTRKEKLVAGGLGLVLACSMGLFGVSNAFAATGNTDVTLQTDDANISVTIPTTMPGTIGSDGTITYPSDIKIVNNSIFGIHVSNIAVADKGIYKVVAESSFSGDSSSDVLWTKVTPAGGAAHDLTTAAPVDGSWNMGSAGSAGNELGLTFAGKIKNISTVPSGAAQAYTITWTVAAGTK